MKYEKQPRSFEEQADLLIHRGMGGDKNLMIRRLAAVNYYRLSGYWYPYRNADDTFQEGTMFETVWRRYVFDRRLRFLVMDAVERIEVSVRSQLAHHHSVVHGPFAYANDPTSRPKMKTTVFSEFYAQILEELCRSKEQFVKHFYSKYGDTHDVPPIWEAVEVMSFGSVVTLFKNTSHKVKQAVSNVFLMPDTVMESWLLAFNTIRNICAHHSRLWNREFGTKPLIPLEKGYPDWHIPVEVKNNRLFAVLTISKYCLNLVAPQSKWPSRLVGLLGEYRDIPIADMGFPENWQDCPIWKEQPHDG